MDLCYAITCISCIEINACIPCIEINACISCIEINACTCMLCWNTPWKKFVKMTGDQNLILEISNIVQKERYLFLPILNSNAVAERMAREYWKMHAQASALVMHSIQCWTRLRLVLHWECITRASAFACIFQYSLSIRSAIPHYNN